MAFFWIHHLKCNVLSTQNNQYRNAHILSRLAWGGGDYVNILFGLCKHTPGSSVQSLFPASNHFLTLSNNTTPHSIINKNVALCWALYAQVFILCHWKASWMDCVTKILQICCHGGTDCKAVPCVHLIKIKLIKNKQKMRGLKIFMLLHCKFYSFIDPAYRSFSHYHVLVFSYDFVADFLHTFFSP